MKKFYVALLIALLPGVLSAGPVNLNSADAATIARELNGVGNARAEAIVEYRRQHGDFKSAEELLDVTGIGPHILESNRDNIRFSAGAED